MLIQMVKVMLRFSLKITDENKIELRFEDCGFEYNPLEREEPDITLSAQERPIGGLEFLW